MRLSTAVTQFLAGAKPLIALSLAIASLGLLVLPVAAEPEDPVDAAAVETFRVPMRSATVTQSFNCLDCVDPRREFPSLRNLWNKYHPGTDYWSANRAVISSARGTVAEQPVTHCGDRGPSCGSGYGNHVWLMHRLSNGSTIYTLYGHLASVQPGLTEGDCVKRGEPLGVMGRTGRVTAAHLHFSIQNNTSYLSYSEDPISATNGGGLNPTRFFGKVTPLQPTGCESGDGDDEPGYVGTVAGNPNRLDWYLYGVANIIDWGPSHIIDHTLSGDWDGDGDDEPGYVGTVAGNPNRLDWYLYGVANIIDWGPSHIIDHTLSGDWDGP